MKFGNFLIDKGYVENHVLAEVLKIQSKHKKEKIGRLLVELGYLEQNKLNLALTQFSDKRLTVSFRQACVT
jgi:hypothetical protein